MTSAFHRARLRSPLALILLALSVSMASCAGRFESFPFLTADGAGIPMRESPGQGRDREGLLEARGSEAATPLYRLARPVLVQTDGEAFALSYSSSLADCALSIYSTEKEELKQVPLPPTGEYSYRLLVPLERGNTIRAFRISTRSKEGSLRLAGAGTAAQARGFSIHGDTVTLDGSVALRGIASRSLDALVSDGAREEMAGKPWLISIQLRPGEAPGEADGGADELVVSFTGQSPQSSRAFSARLDPGWRRMEFSAGTVGFAPREIHVGLRASATGKSGLSPLVQALEITRVDGARPIPADPGSVLDYRRTAWRRPDFELFSWDRFPHVLILDTADYAVQDNIFKRLAFFVEKPGYAGTIPDSRELSGKHGWNAHDYRADDLARFFSAAMAKGVALTAGELDLRRILLDNGIIASGDSSYSPGRGAVLSISRESPAALRRLLLTHECFHGVFFSLAEYRDACGKAWSALSDGERELWSAFFGLTGYDTANGYLEVNEFQSYLFQQPREGVAAFQVSVLGKLDRKYPDRAHRFRRLIEGNPDSFLHSFDMLDRALAAAGGPRGGLAISVEAE